MSSLGPTIGSYILSGKVLGYLYDKESMKYQQQHDDVVEENACYGRRCFEFGLLSLASICFVGVIACLWFTHRTKKMYKRFGHAFKADDILWRLVCLCYYYWYSLNANPKFPKTQHGLISFKRASQGLCCSFVFTIQRFVDVRFHIGNFVS